MEPKERAAGGCRRARLGRSHVVGRHAVSGGAPVSGLGLGAGFADARHAAGNEYSQGVRVLLERLPLGAEQVCRNCGGRCWIGDLGDGYPSKGPRPGGLQPAFGRSRGRGRGNDSFVRRKRWGAGLRSGR